MSHPSESLTGKNYTIGLRNTQYTKIAHEELAIISFAIAYSWRIGKQQ